MRGPQGQSCKLWTFHCCLATVHCQLSSGTSRSAPRRAWHIYPAQAEAGSFPLLPIKYKAYNLRSLEVTVEGHLMYHKAKAAKRSHTYFRPSDRAMGNSGALGSRGVCSPFTAESVVLLSKGLRVWCPPLGRKAEGQVGPWQP